MIKENQIYVIHSQPDISHSQLRYTRTKKIHPQLRYTSTKKNSPILGEKLRLDLDCKKNFYHD